MNKKILPTALYIITALLVIGFGVRLGVDYFKLYEFGSSPFYVYIIVRFAEFIIPAILCFVIGFILQKKERK